MPRALVLSALVLLAASGSATAAPCPTCIVDLTVTRTAGPPTTRTLTFAADAALRYRITIDLPGGGSPIWVTLNGVALMTPETAPSGGGPVVFDDRALLASNTIVVRLAGRPHGSARVQVEPLAPSGLAPCPAWSGAVARLFTAPLVPLAQMTAIQPLGSLGPPSHTLPTHHTYWDNGVVRDTDGRPSRTGIVPVFSPGDVRVVALQYSVDDEDFKVILRPCLEVQLYVDHVFELSASLQAAYESARRYEHPGGVLALLDLPLRSGDLIGIGGGAPFDADGVLLGNSGVNVGLIDLRRPERPFANPDRYRLPDNIGDIVPPGLPPEDVALIVRDFPPQRLYQFCPLDYFDEPLAEQYRELLGSGDGLVRRTIEPRCGDLMHDVPGTLQGGWFEDKPANGLGPDYSNDIDESRLLAFAPHHVDPTQLTLSIGLGVEAPAGSASPWHIPAGTYAFGLPRAAGVVNRAFADVVPGATYCYQDVAPPFVGSVALTGVVVVELAETELWIMRLPDESCATVPPTLSVRTAAAARRYVR